ncbi:MAG TPA: hypothetical protein PKE40_10675 [Arachnia sp.]|nr:hypothetical protein [Arachnia sp.]HMT86808.1 hypothetical protein [Arachnia sp.]
MQHHERRRWARPLVAAALTAGLTVGALLPGTPAVADPGPVEATPILKTSESTWVHPGILNSQADLERMREKATGPDAAKPWQSSFADLEELVDTYLDPSDPAYIDVDTLALKRIVRANSGGGNEMRVAATKVYNLAVASWITGDDEYSQLVRDVFDRYADIFEGLGSLSGTVGENVLYDTNLTTAVIGLKFSAAAEILRFDAARTGWTNADTENVEAIFEAKSDDAIASMVTLMRRQPEIAPYSMNNMVHGHAVMLDYGSIAYAVFTEDADLYNAVVTRFTTPGSEWEVINEWTKPPIGGASGGSVFFNVNSVTGQNKEVDRDIAHSLINVSGLTQTAQIAFLQGDPALYEAGDRTLLKGMEFLARHNLGFEPLNYDYAFPWNVHNRPFEANNVMRLSLGPSTFNRGIISGGTWELAYNHYRFFSDASTAEYSSLEALVNNTTLMPEPVGYDVTGWGTLLFSQPQREADYQTLPAKPRITDPTVIPAGAYSALVSNEHAPTTELDGEAIRVSGGDAVISYPQIDLGTTADPTTKIALRLSSTTSGTIEVRSQSPDGTRFGQPKSFGDSYGLGNTGSLLTTIPFPSTGGAERLIGALALKPSGQPGGELVRVYDLEQLFLVVRLDDPDGELTYREVLLRPGDDAEIQTPEAPPVVDPVTGEIDYLNGSVLTSYASNDPESVLATVSVLKDGDPSTFTDIFGPGGWWEGQAWIVMDFGEGNSVSLTRAEIQARQDQFASIGPRIGGAFVQGSSDGTTWVPLTQKATVTPDPQTLAGLPEAADTSYRYLRIVSLQPNGQIANWWANMSELHLFGAYFTPEPEVLEVSASATTRCVAGKVVVAASVTNGEETPVEVSLASLFGSKALASLAGGRTASAAFTTRQVTVSPGTVDVTAVADGVTTTLSAPYAAASCG